MGIYVPILSSTLPRTSSLSCPLSGTIFSNMVCCPRSEWCVATSFYTQGCNPRLFLSAFQFAKRIVPYRKTRRKSAYFLISVVVKFVPSLDHAVPSRRRPRQSPAGTDRRLPRRREGGLVPSHGKSPAEAGPFPESAYVFLERLRPVRPSPRRRPPRCKCGNWWPPQCARRPSGRRPRR